MMPVGTIMLAQWNKVQNGNGMDDDISLLITGQGQGYDRRITLAGIITLIKLNTHYLV